MSADRPRYKRRFRNFLLDRRFQLKYTLMIVLAGGLIFGSMEYLFYAKVEENSELVGLGEDNEFAAELSAELEDADREILLRLAAFWLALVSLLFIVGVLATHRIVGPIYVVNRYVKMIREGKPIHPRPLRRGDEFQELHRNVHEMAQALRDERDHDLEAVQRVLETISVRLGALPDGSAEEAKAFTEHLLADLEPLRELIKAKRAYLDAPES